MFSSNKKPSHHLVLTAILTGSLTILFSSVYIALTILGLIFRFNCELSGSLTPSDLFMNTVFRTYILSSTDCPNTTLIVPGITSDHSVFILNIITLCFSMLSLISAIILVSALTSNSKIKFFREIIFSYVAITISCIIVDLTFATHFGMDYTFLSNQMNSESTYIQTDYQRLGAVLFMTVSLKGFLGPAMNIVLLVLLIIYAKEYIDQNNKSQHSIHQLGVVNAFETHKRNEFCGHPCEICRMSTKGSVNTSRGNGGGSQLNYGYQHDDEPPRSPRNPPNNNSLKQDYSNSSGFNRSNSWQTAPPSSRPFSYLDDIKRPVPVRAPPSPSSDSAWRRDPWQPGMPPVPAPDYSPNSPRRLKPALKSYM